MVTMKDIALRYGVSVATVSKALNNQKDIGEKTRDEIRAIAKEMGYTPNALAKQLKTNKTYNIGVLFVDEGHSGLTHDYFSNVLDQFKNKVESKGYNLTFINSCKESDERLTYLEQTRSKNFDGVIIACVNFKDPEVIELLESSVPLVIIDHAMENRCSIVSDNTKGMNDLTEYIINKGHRKIAYIYGDDTSVTDSRIKSFKNTCIKHGIEIPQNYLCKSSYRNMRKSYEATEELLDGSDCPTCIIYPDDFSALGGISCLMNRGLKIPEDISVAGYDGLSVVRHFRPKITTIKQNTKGIGEAAASKLIDLIENKDSTKIEVITIEGEVFEGESISNIK